MTKSGPHLCPHCGQPLPSQALPAAPQERLEEREYDHRGVLLPRRTRVGGMIVPQ